MAIPEGSRSAPIGTPSKRPICSTIQKLKSTYERDPSSTLIHNTWPGERDISAQVTIRSPCRSPSRPIAIPQIPLSHPASHGINEIRLRQRADDPEHGPGSVGLHRRPMQQGGSASDHVQLIGARHAWLSELIGPVAPSHSVRKIKSSYFQHCSKITPGGHIDAAKCWPCCGSPGHSDASRHQRNFRVNLAPGRYRAFRSAVFPSTNQG